MFDIDHKNPDPMTYIGPWKSFRFNTLTMPLSSDPKQNHLLAALPPAEWLRWESLLEPVDMSLGQVVYESGGTLSHVYFPTTCIVS